MAKPRVFYSFHFDNDVMRVQQIRNIGVIEGNEPVAKNEWEQIRKTESGIKLWIDENMKFKTCIIVLIGSDTAYRPWVQYEIIKGWNDKKGVVGIYIHNLIDPRYSNVPPYFGRCVQGPNPFTQIFLKNGLALSNYVTCYNPDPANTYNDIASNLTKWIDNAPKLS